MIAGHVPSAVQHAHEAVDKLAETLGAAAREHAFQLDALQHMNRELTANNIKLRSERNELQAEVARLQAEIESRAADLSPAKKTPRKPKTPKPVVAPVPADADAP